MKERACLVAGVVVVSVAAAFGCASSSTSSSQSSSGTHEIVGSSSSGGCNTCGDVVSMGYPSKALCKGEAGTDYEGLETCMCDQGPCGGSCQNTACNGKAADDACTMCLSMECTTFWQACMTD